MVIVDSSVWIDYLAARSSPETLWLKRQVADGSIGLTDLILCEVLQGIRRDDEFRDVSQMLAEFAILHACGVEVAMASAENYRILRAKGITVRKTIDCLIATFCIRRGHVLLHCDADFDHFEKHLGLRVLHPELRASFS